MKANHSNTATNWPHPEDYQTTLARKWRVKVSNGWYQSEAVFDFPHAMLAKSVRISGKVKKWANKRPVTSCQPLD